MLAASCCQLTTPAFGTPHCAANVVFWLLQLKGSFVLFWLVYLCTLATGIVLAYTVAAISPNMDVANAALPTYVVVRTARCTALPRFSSASFMCQLHAPALTLLAAVVQTLLFFAGCLIRWDDIPNYWRW
jgi:hypothetical protein